MIIRHHTSLLLTCSMDCIFTTLGSEDEREQLMHRVLEVSLGMLAKNENKKKTRVLDL